MKNLIGREHSINSQLACELDMINVISAAAIAFIMSSSTSAWLLSPLKCSPQKQNRWTLRFCFRRWIMWTTYNKTIIEFGFRMISWIIKTSCLCYLPQPSASADNTDLGFDNSWYHTRPHPIIVHFLFLPYVLLFLKSSDEECFNRNILFRHDQNLCLILCLISLHFFSYQNFYFFIKSPQNGGKNCNGESRGLPRMCNVKVQIWWQLIVTSIISNNRT